MNKIIDLLNEKELPTIDGDKYLYNGIVVPRVTEILSNMLHEDYLMKWSNNIGLYKHQKYSDVLEKASDIGTCVHDMIEKYISDTIEPDFENVSLNMRNNVYTAFNSFLQWWNIIKQNDCKVIMQENELICQYYGGTLDLLLEINGKIYLTDFKTSNHPSYKYYLQLSAYRYMLKILYNIDIDGCIVLMLNKTQLYFEEMILNFDDISHLEFINHCEDTFHSLVFAFYNRKKTENMYTNIFGGK